MIFIKILAWICIIGVFIYLKHELYLLIMWLNHYYICNKSSAFIGTYNIFISEFKKSELLRLVKTKNTFCSDEQSYLNDITKVILHTDRAYYIDLLYFKFDGRYMVLYYNDYCMAMKFIKNRYKEYTKRKNWIMEDSE